MRENTSVANASVSRRALLAGGAGSVAAAGLFGPLTPLSRAGATRAAAQGPVPAPEPIPGGLPVGLPPPFDLIHLFLPGPTSVTLPFSGLGLMGLDVEPTTVTSFRGQTAMTYLVGAATGSDGRKYGLEVDLRVSEGEYVPADGSRQRGLFALI